MSTATRNILTFTAAIVVALAGLTGLACKAVHAQGPNTTTATQQPTPATPSKIAKKPDAKPTWSDLTPAQQHALAPLAGEWKKMGLNGKEKWLVIGNKFAAMSPAEQERMQERMRDWVKLTPVERRSVRESYTRAKKLDADKKSAQWKEYQQLSDEQKKKLSQAKLPKHVAALPPTQAKAAPTIQLPPEALEQTLVPSPVLVTPTAATPTEVK